MPPKRKKWQVCYPDAPDTTDTFPSRRAAYEWLQSLARAHFADPAATGPHAEVWVDVGDSRGWQRYEDVDLAEWTHLAPAKEA